MYNYKKYSVGSTWFDTERRVHVECVYVRSWTDFRILGRPPGEIYGVPYEQLDTRMVRRKIKMK